jgi:hypothetical protein
MKRAPRRRSLQGKHRLEDEYLLQLTWPKIEIRLPNYVVVSCTREEEKVTPEKEEYLVSDLVGLMYFEQEATEGY